MNENLDDFVNEATGQNADGNGLTLEQYVAIKIAAELGKRLQDDLPEIADDYRNRMTQYEISLKYDIQETYGVSRNVAITAISNALGGSNSFGSHAGLYTGLIEDPEERENIRLEHLRESSRKNGNELAEMGLGIHGLTIEQRREYGRKSAMARGFDPWVPAEETEEHYKFSEVEIAFMLSQCPEYRIGKHVSNAKIADELNRLFHNQESVRSVDAVSSQLSIYRRETGKDPLAGRVPWVPAEETEEQYKFSEVEIAFMLSQCPEYKRGKYVKGAKIADELNRLFHNQESVRSADMVNVQLSIYRRETGKDPLAGRVPWVPAEETEEQYKFSELEVTFRLSQRPEYRRGTLVKGAKIADELNRLFHDGESVRTADAVSAQLSIYRRETGDAIRERYVPWVPAEETNEHYTFSEGETAYRMSQRPEYKSGSLIKNAKIADELNTLFHGGEFVRDARTVSAQLSRYRRETGDAIRERYVPWVPAEETDDNFSEVEVAFKLSQRPEYRIGPRVNNVKIAGELNRLFHDGESVRSADMVTSQLYKKYRKEAGKDPLAKRIVPWVLAEETEEHYKFSELEIALMFSQCPEYRRGKYVKGAKIADELNTLFHDGESVRSATAVSAQLSIYRKETGEV